jgi:curved DNA-binding protein CbpA
MIDYYEFLQINPTSDAETIHRVYQFFAARYHPDNQESGDSGMFRLVKTAYDVLSDRKRRAEYDAQRKDEWAKPLSTSVDFLDIQQGELNRRMALLVVLYYRRRRSPNSPGVSLRDIEERMGFPRDLLDFTLWYLHQRGLISRTDNAQFALTVDGVDFIEKERANIPIVNKLLTSSASEVSTEAAASALQQGQASDMNNDPDQPSGPIRLPESSQQTHDQRKRASDRRNGAPDDRDFKFDRRKNRADRRAVA